MTEQADSRDGLHSNCSWVAMTLAESINNFFMNLDGWARLDPKGDRHELR